MVGGATSAGWSTCGTGAGTTGALVPTLSETGAERLEGLALVAVGLPEAVGAAVCAGMGEADNMAASCKAQGVTSGVAGGVLLALALLSDLVLEGAASAGGKSLPAGLPLLPDGAASGRTIACGIAAASAAAGIVGGGGRSSTGEAVEAPALCRSAEKLTAGAAPSGDGAANAAGETQGVAERDAATGGLVSIMPTFIQDPCQTACAREAQAFRVRARSAAPAPGLDRPRRRGGVRLWRGDAAWHRRSLRRGAPRPGCCA